MQKFTRKLWSDYKEYFLLVVLLLISLYLIAVSEHPQTRQFRALVFGGTAVVSSTVSDLINVDNLRSENERLRRKNAELMLQVSRLREYGIANRELSNLLGLKDTLHYDLVPAKIVSKSLTTAEVNFQLNAGSDDGLGEGMPVINDAGLVGLVYEVSATQAIVRTLKHHLLKLVVKDERSRTNGIMRWNGESLTITNLPKTSNIQTGDRIVTSEISSLVSLPVPVGIVSDVINPERGLFNDLVIEPFVDFIRVEHVFVVKRVNSAMIDDVEINFFNLNK